MKLARKTTMAAALALLGFAANSILCRMALAEESIDARSFTAVRLGAGAVMLVLIARRVSGRMPPMGDASWISGLALFVYAAAFSIAYLRLSAGVGALVLFACVQVTMIAWGMRSGERLKLLEGLGVVLALSGLGVLAAGGDAAADPIGLLLMGVAGIAWGAYSIRGRSSRAPLLSNAANFVWSVPLALAVLPFGREELHADARGFGLALASGALASGLGYSLWYLALPALTAKRAAIVQLLVPVLAAVAGVVLLGEDISARLVFASAMILCGVGVASLLRASQPPPPAESSEGGRPGRTARG